MMFRRNAAQTPRVNQQRSIIEQIRQAVSVQGVLDVLTRLGIYEAAQRENRRRNRAQKRWSKHTAWRGVCGTRETARRRRQIERGQLTVANGLVQS